MEIELTELVTRLNNVIESYTFGNPKTENLVNELNSISTALSFLAFELEEQDKIKNM